MIGLAPPPLLAVLDARALTLPIPSGSAAGRPSRLLHPLVQAQPVSTERTGGTLGPAVGPQQASVTPYAAPRPSQSPSAPHPSLPTRSVSTTAH